MNNLPLIERQLDSSLNYKSYAEENSKNINRKLFVFDPNNVSAEQLLALGLKEKTASIFIKFRQKGFVFKKKEDLKKVYGISEKLYSVLEPYILINVAEKTIRENKPASKELKICELNSADSLQLLEINGIGPSFAKRIIKYRSLLGGYANTEQLKEVYGFTEEMYDKVKSQISVNATLITKLNLNTDDFKTVNKHPYISYETTKLIFEKRRKEKITLTTLQEIINDEELMKKLTPYLNF